MTERATLTIHLNTDRLNGDLQIDFDPVEGDHIPVGPAEWGGLGTDSPMRERLRRAVRDEIDDIDGWKAHLDSDRAGERLDVQIGTAVVTSEDQIESVELSYTHPEDVDW